jgi:hypothetical protein
MGQFLHVSATTTKADCRANEIESKSQYKILDKKVFSYTFHVALKP